MTRNIVIFLVALITGFGVVAVEAKPKSAFQQSLMVMDANGTVVGGRPSGCPHAYCGCEASLYLFGHIRTDLTRCQLDALSAYFTGAGNSGGTQPPCHGPGQPS